MNPHQLAERGQYWAELLHLTEWNIRFSYAEPHELGEAWADADFDPYHRTANIRILAPAWAHLQKWPVPEYSVDFSLVHELVHLLLEPCGVNDTSTEQQLITLEQLVNRITETVISLESEATNE
jgi:hypothetical protein